MKLYIKYMVSLRCRMKVKDVLTKLKLKYAQLSPGMVELQDELSAEQKDCLKNELRTCDLELLNDTESADIENIQNVIIEMIHYSNERSAQPYAEQIAQKLNKNYEYLYNHFAEIKGVTIDQYILIHEIEKAKELLWYDDLSFEEIASNLGYSGTKELEANFKKITGFSPTFYSDLKKKRKIKEAEELSTNHKPHNHKEHKI